MSSLPGWLSSHLLEFGRAIDADRRAHAYLISGPRGVGKRALAAAMARRVMDEPAGAGDGPDWPSRADFHRIAPAEDKTALAVEQIRSLIGELAMTAYEGATKVAIVEAADTMSVAAANALLKTLEEPPGDCLIVLVADRLLNLPATILSRCVHMKLAPPAEREARQWLGEGDPDAIDSALTLANGAPFLARKCLADGTANVWARLQNELDELVRTGADATALAQSWSRLDTPLVLTFFVAVVADAINARLGTGQLSGVCPPAAQSAVSSVDVRDLFCYQDRALRLRAQPKGAYSEPAAIESLLLPWQNGFAGTGEELPLLPLVNDGETRTTQ